MKQAAQESLEAYARGGKTHQEVLIRLRELGLPSTAITPVVDSQGGYRFICKECGNSFLHSTSRGRAFCTDECRAGNKALSTKKTWAYSEEKKKEISEKRSQTNLSRHGVVNPFQSPKWMAAARETMMEKYGAGYSMQVPELKKLAKETNMERYGTEVGSQSDAIKEKTRSTVVERYGEVSPILNPDVKERAISSMKLRRNDRLTQARNQLDSIGKELFTFAEAKRALGLSSSRTLNVIRELGYDSRIIWNRSIVNSDWAHLIESRLGVKPETEGHIFTNPRSRADFVFPTQKVAVDINPTITHSTQETPANKHFGGYRTSTTYHRDRALDARKNGWRLIQIFDWYDVDKVMDILRSALGLETKKVYARQCEVVQVAAKEAAEFIDRHHLQGAGAVGSYRYGLTFQGELRAVMTFSKARFGYTSSEGEEGTMEIIRLCSDGIVVGGASRLFKSFLRDHPEVKRVMTFTDLSLGHGGVYPMLGFREVRVAHLNAYYAHTNTGVAYKTTALSGGKLWRLFPEADEGLSQKEIMNAHGYYRINDAGHMVYEYEVKD